MPAIEILSILNQQHTIKKILLNLQKSRALFTSFLLCFLFVACQQKQPTLSSLYTPLSARANYENSLKEKEGFDKNKLVEWDSIGNLAFSKNVEIPTPYRQTGFFLKGKAEVLAFEIPLKLGEQIEIQLTSDTADV